jgi:hypothetical protein
MNLPKFKQALQLNLTKSFKGVVHLQCLEQLKGMEGK